MLACRSLQASYPYGNFFGTSSFKFQRSDGSIDHTLTVGTFFKETWLVEDFGAKMDQYEYVRRAFIA